jgi:integrase
MRVAHDLKGLVVASLRNKDVLAYIGELRKSPRQLDDPRFQHLKKAKAKAKEPTTARARANEKYKAKIRAEELKRKPKVPPPMAEATVRKIFYALKKSINWFESDDGPVHRSIFKFAKDQVPSAWSGNRDRRLNEGEEEKLLHSAMDRGGYTYTREDWAAMIGFALETAMREQEIAKAEFNHIWSKGNKLVIPKKNPKTKKERNALLSKRAKAIIAQQLASSPEGNKRIFHQFPNAKAICDGFARLTARAGIEDLHFHDLRHEATSRLCESGKLQQIKIMEMTGNENLVTFGRYVKPIAHENAQTLE